MYAIRLDIAAIHPPQEGDDVTSKVSRRSLVTTAAAIPALAVPAVAIAKAAQLGSSATDPIYAAISTYIELEEQASGACEVYAEAEEQFRAEFGSPPDALNREWWDAWWGAWDEQVSRSYNVFDHACNLWSDAAARLFATRPTSLAGVRALMGVIRQRPILSGFCESDPDGSLRLLETLTTALAQAPA